MHDTFEAGHPVGQVHTEPLTVDRIPPDTEPLEPIQQAPEITQSNNFMPDPETSPRIPQDLLHPDDTVGLPENIQRLLNPFVMQNASEGERAHENEQFNPSLTHESPQQKPQTQSFPHKSATITQFPKNSSFDEQSGQSTKKEGRLKKFFKKIGRGLNSFWRGLRSSFQSDQKRAAKMLQELEEQEKAERLKAT